MIERPEIEVTARHEASHAVMVSLMGGTVHMVSAHPYHTGSEDLLGGVRSTFSAVVRTTSGYGSAEERIQAGLVLAAGVALSWFECTNGDPWEILLTEGASDYDQMRRLGYTDKQVVQLIRRAGLILKRPKVAQYVTSLTNKLLATGSVRDYSIPPDPELSMWTTWSPMARKFWNPTDNRVKVEA